MPWLFYKYLSLLSTLHIPELEHWLLVLLCLVKLSIRIYDYLKLNERTYTKIYSKSQFFEKDYENCPANVQGGSLDPSLSEAGRKTFSKIRQSKLTILTLALSCVQKLFQSKFLGINVLDTEQLYFILACYTPQKP